MDEFLDMLHSKPEVKGLVCLTKCMKWNIIMTATEYNVDNYVIVGV